jgi:hypothetical protein
MHQDKQDGKDHQLPANSEDALVGRVIRAPWGVPWVLQTRPSYEKSATRIVVT